MNYKGNKKFTTLNGRSGYVEFFIEEYQEGEPGYQQGELLASLRKSFKDQDEAVLYDPITHQEEIFPLKLWKDKDPNKTYLKWGWDFNYDMP